MSTTTSPILFEAAENYANETSDVSIRPDLRMAFVAGAEWQWNRDAEINDLIKDVEFWKAHSLANAELVDLERGRREAKDAEIELLRKALTGLRSYFLTHGWDEKSMMIDSIDQALNGGGNGRS